MGGRREGEGFRRPKGASFRVQGSGFKVQGSGFRVQGSGFKVQGSYAPEGLVSGFRRVQKGSDGCCLKLLET